MKPLIFSTSYRFASTDNPDIECPQHKPVMSNIGGVGKIVIPTADQAFNLHPSTFVDELEDMVERHMRIHNITAERIHRIDPLERAGFKDSDEVRTAIQIMKVRMARNTKSQRN